MLEEQIVSFNEQIEQMKQDVATSGDKVRGNSRKAYNNRRFKSTNNKTRSKEIQNRI